MLKNRLIFFTDQTRKYILLGILFQELSLIARIVSVFQIGDLLNAVIRGRPYDRLLYRVLAVIAVCLILQAVSARFQTRMEARSVTDIGRTIREKIYDKIMTLGASYREKVPLTEIIYLSTEGVPQIEAFYEKFIPKLIYSATAPVTLFLFMTVAINVRSSLVFLLCTPLLTVIGFMIMRAFKNMRSAYHDDYSTLRAHFMENLRGLPTLKLYRADDIKADEMIREAEEFSTSAMRFYTLQMVEEGAAELFALMGCLMGILVGTSEYVYGTFSLTGCIILILLSVEFFIPSIRLCEMLRSADTAYDISKRLTDFLEIKEPQFGSRELNVPHIYSETEEVVLANMDRYERPRFLKKSGISYTLSDVHFSYTQGREILHGVNMVLPPESFVSLVGPSGSGKSTVAEILCGKLKNYKGEIKVGCDGRSMNLYDIREPELLSHVVLVKTSSHIFRGTIEENLRMAKKNADDQELLDALDAVHLLPFIRSHDGLKTQIEAGGANLSAGEAQRLAIARALLKDAEVLIFDETTSNIDADSEACIMSVIKELSRRKTVLLISHRLSNVTDCDCIYVMDNGLIRESGTHEELLARRGIYNKLYRTQKSLEDYSTGDMKYEGKEQQILHLKGAHKAAGNAQSSRKSEGPGTGPAGSGKKKNTDKHRNVLVLLAELTGLVSPAFYLTLLAAFLGMAATLCLLFIPVITGSAVMNELSQLRHEELLSSPVARYFQFAVLLVILRIIFSAGEKYLSHFAAHRILSQIRHEVYTSLRRLAPARFEKQDKAELVQVLTDDIEHLETFYAETTGRTLAALLAALAIGFYLWAIHMYAGILMLAGYMICSVLIPMVRTHLTTDASASFRHETGELGSFLLDQLNGIDDLQQYGNGEDGKQQLTARCTLFDEAHEQYEGTGALWNILEKSGSFLFSFGMFFLTLFLHIRGQVSVSEVVTCTIIEFYSFKFIPTLFGLSGNTGKMLAGGDLILDILEERPVVQDVSEAEGKLGWDGYKRFHGAEMSRVTFAYDNETILQDFTILLWPKQLIGIHGPEGCGKSTILKLLLRFWDVDNGSITICGEDIKNIATRRLRDAESYMAQDTVIFHDSIANNIAIGKPGASRVEIIRAAKKAALHDFILSLPKGYDTQIDELGNRLSDGERKRIGIARAFLHNAPLVLLDEPTGQLDSLNEGMILKALVEECREKTIVIASTRDSAMRACDTVFKM